MRTGKRDDAIALMREAAELEHATPKHAVTPGPTLPADEQLGDLLLAHAQPAQALAAYRRSLEQHPNRFNSIAGAARAADAMGDAGLARDYYSQLLQTAKNGTRQGVLDEARHKLDGAPGK